MQYIRIAGTGYSSNDLIIPVEDSEVGLVLKALTKALYAKDENYRSDEYEKIFTEAVERVSFTIVREDQIKYRSDRSVLVKEREDAKDAQSKAQTRNWELERKVKDLESKVEALSQVKVECSSQSTEILEDVVENTEEN